MIEYGPILDHILLIKDTQGTNAKIELARQGNEMYGKPLRLLLQAAMSPYKHYGVTKKVEPHPKNCWPQTDLIEIIDGLEEIPKNNLNLSLFSATINNVFLKDTYRDIIWDIVTKKLKIGLDVKNLNKAGYNIPRFDCMLACTNKDNSVGTMPFPALLSAKMDGVRCITLPGSVPLGRSGKPCPNVKLAQWMPDLSKGDEAPYWVLDGEFYQHGVPFDEISGLWRAKDRDIPEGYRYHLFNVFTEDEWLNQEITVPYTEVLDRIESLVEAYPDHFAAAHNLPVANEDEVSRTLQGLWEQGYEGGILRNTGSPAYMWKRCSLKDNCMIKLKKIDYTDAKIIGFVEGEGKYQGMLGSLHVELENGIDFEIGTGYTDDQRVELWQDRDELLGEWVHCKFTELTETGMPRPPVVFINIRDNKG